MGSISTQGWDTVFAVRLPEVNATLARAVADKSAQLPDIHWTSDDGRREPGRDLRHLVDLVEGGGAFGRYARDHALPGA